LDSYRGEDEQLDALKKWWQENGSSLLISVAVALAAVVGWRSWQGAQQAQLDASSLAYQELLQAVAAAESEPDDIKIATASHLAEQIKSDYSDSGYSHFAAFFKAQQAVNDEDFALAESELRWVIEQQPLRETELTALLRLAKVVFAQDRADEALALLVREDSGAFAPAFFELRGDILLAGEDYRGAVDAYDTSQRRAEALQMVAPQTVAAKLGYAKSLL